MNHIFFKALLAGSIFCFFSCSSENYNLEVAPPFEKVTVAFDEFEINPAEEKLIRLESGTSIQIPKDAFVDKNGNPVKGKVKLEYREFNSAADIIASGIPMTYEDEEGNNQQMESAGMFELNGKVGNEEVFLATGKKVQVNMASPVKGDYDFFYLEEEGKSISDEASFISSAFGQSSQGEKKKSRWVKLTNNVKENKTKEAEVPSFKLQLDTTKYPEIKALKDVNWKVAVESEVFNPLAEKNKWVLAEKWDKVDIHSAGKLVKVINCIPMGKEHRYVSMFPDSTELFVTGKKSAIYNFDGKKTAEFNGEQAYWGYFNGNHSPEDRILIKNGQGNILLYSRNGKLIKSLGKVSLRSGLDKTNYLFTNDEHGFWNIIGRSSSSNIHSVFVVNKNGEKLADIVVTPMAHKFKENLISSEYASMDVSDDAQYFALESQEGIRVFNSSGKLLASLPVSNDQIKIEFTSFKNNLLLDYKDNVQIWDWKENKFFLLPQDIYHKVDLYDSYAYWGWSKTHSQYPLVMFNSSDNKSVYLWNWETGKIVTINSSNGHTSFRGNNFVFQNGDDKDGKEYVWNLEGKLLTENKGDIYFSEDEKLYFILSDTKLECRDSTWKLIRDFKKTDTAISAAYSLFADMPIVSSTKNGEIRIWNEKGEQVKSLFLNIPAKAALLSDDELLISVSEDGKFTVWDTSGSFITDYSFTLSSFKPFKYKNKLALTHEDNLVFLEILPEKAPVGSYQIVLNNAVKSFITYVYLSDEDLSRLKEFNNLKKKNIKQEEVRQEREAALIRSFEVSRFGIYNWDRFYKNENVVQAEADFDFGNAVTQRNNVSVFLIAGEDQNTVIKYPEHDWSKFSFDPAVPNQLIAVLPEDRIAVFTKEDFEKLDAEEIKKSKKYTFKMKVLDKVSSTKELSKILKAPV